jgi:hypothetical protein
LPLFQIRGILMGIPPDEAEGEVVTPPATLRDRASNFRGSRGRNSAVELTPDGKAKKAT